MTSSTANAFKRGTTSADTARVHRLVARRRPLLIAVVSAVVSMIVTTSQMSAERPFKDAVTKDMQHPSLAALAIPLDDMPEAVADRVLDAPRTAVAADVTPAPVPADPVAERDPCGEARSWVADAGLPLPPGVGYHCPSTEFPHHGAACWNNRYCPGTGFIAVNLDLIGSPTAEYLRHVVAHEVCHILDFQSTGVSTEAGADACAAAHGAPA
ncbi:MAG: hypothetical protein M3326_07120 [Actinomycetota bacterium]|nr:hypothetical protein [Actinomycetota bacterium]